MNIRHRLEEMHARTEQINEKVNEFVEFICGQVNAIQQEMGLGESGELPKYTTQTIEPMTLEIENGEIKSPPLAPKLQQQTKSELKSIKKKLKKLLK